MAATPVFLLENPMDRGAWWAAAIGSQRVGQIHQSFLLCLIRLFLSHLRIIAYLKVINKLSFFLYNIYCFTFIFVSLQ